MTEDYQIGYRKPPRETQFNKGRSGNPAGRPKGSKSIATIFQEVTRELIHVTQNGKQRTVTKLEAIMLQLTSKALSGDMKAVKEILQCYRIFDESASRESTNNPDREKDEMVMQSVIRRIRQRNQPETDEKAGEPGATEIR